MTILYDRPHRTGTAITFVSWFGAVLFAIWTASPYGTYAVLDLGTDWFVEAHGYGWPGSAVETLFAIDALTVGSLWLGGSILIVAVTLHLRRLASRIR